jgi:DNA-binding response OmpR family regulator
MRARRRGRLLIVEPDPLTRWSMSTYLKRWFEVTTADSADMAGGLLEGKALEAIVVTGELPEDQFRSIEQRARHRNPDVITVRTVTDLADSDAALADGEKPLEKPFELAQLARLLGVSDAEIPR